MRLHAWWIALAAAVGTLIIGKRVAAVTLDEDILGPRAIAKSSDLGLALLAAALVRLWPALFASSLYCTASLAVTACELQPPKGTEEAIRVVESSAEFLWLTEPILARVYEASQRECLKLESAEQAERCVEQTRAEWRQVRRAMGEVRASWCALDQAIGEGKCEK